MQPPDPLTTEAVPTSLSGRQERTPAAFSKAGGFVASADPTARGARVSRTVRGVSSQLAALQPTSCAGKSHPSAKKYCGGVGTKLWGAQAGEGSRCLAFPSKPLSPEAPLPCASDSPCNTHNLGSRMEGKGLRQPCGLQFSSSQAHSSSTDLHREAGEAGVTAGWSCSMSRGNGNKTRVDYIPSETLQKKKKRQTRERGKKGTKESVNHRLCLLAVF